MGSLVVLVIMLGCGAYQYFKGSVFKAIVTIIITICASTVAFGYFELLADFFISKGSSSRFPALVPWAQPLCFTLLFVLAFAILQTGAVYLTRMPVDFGFLPERIGRVICGIFLGLILSGLLLTVLAMAPLPNQYPYQRFDSRNPSPQRPSKVLFNADGFATGWFSLLSRGSFRAISNPRSFAVLHPGYLDQLFLNRHNNSDDILLVTSAQSIDVPSKEGAWYAPTAGIKDTDGKPITPRSGYSLVVVRMGMKKTAVKDAGKFTLAQLRLTCKEKGATTGPLEGKAVNAYPIGYFSGPDLIQTRRLNEVITVERDDFGSETRRYIDFAFEVLSDHTPALLEFKLNNIAEVHRVVSSDQAPAPMPFVERTKTEETTDSPNQRPGNYPSRNQDSSDSSRRRGLSDIGKSLTGIDGTE